MKKLCLILSLIMLMAAMPYGSAAESGDNSAPISTAEPQSLPAFPGAEGGGMYAAGARAAAKPEIYHVTTLKDYDKNAGESPIQGSLRDAVSRGNRIIVFDVAGNIELKARLNISGGDLTILGQTAPGDGICVTGYDTHINSSNVILRYLRFRMGDKNDVEDDSLGGRNIKNVIVDHCSISWSVDECASFYDNTNFTMQWCIISESLNNSVHAKGSHGYGGIWGGANASFHHNLMAHHKSRNPRAPEGDFKMLVGIDDGDYDMSQQRQLSDWRNNVIYNWGSNSAYGGQAAMAVNIVNCYYKSGPATGSGVKNRIYELSSTGNDKTFVWSTDLYLDGNHVEGYPDITVNNALGVSKDSTAQNYYVWTSGPSGTNNKNVNYSPISENADARNVHFKYSDEYPVKTQSAEQAYEEVLAKAGASYSRDSLDARVVEDVRNGTAEHGNNGIIDTPSEAGGLPYLSGIGEPDSDKDGLPDRWEDQNGSDKNSAADAAEILPSGYARIEEYANDLADGSFVKEDIRPTATPIPTNTHEPTPTPTPTPKATTDPLSLIKWEIVDNKTVTITGLRGTKVPSELNIPNEIEGLPVTAIGDSAFERKGIMKVTLPDSVEVIGTRAFSQSGLDEIELPKNLRTIGANAFAMCGFSRVEIPAGVTEIKGSSFMNCQYMKEIIVDSENQTFHSDDGVLFSKDMSILVSFPAGRSGEYRVPEKVASIGESAFAYSGVNPVIVSADVKEIDVNAFIGCVNLESIYLPNDLSEIMRRAFMNCAKLKDVYFDGTEEKWNTITINEDGNNYLLSAQKHFNASAPTPMPTNAPTPTPTKEPLVTPQPEHTPIVESTATPTVEPTATPTVEPVPTPTPDSLSQLKWQIIDNQTVTIIGYNGSPENLEIPSKIEGLPVTAINNSAFQLCSSLKTVTLPDTLETIGASAFARCPLERIEFPNSLKSIGAYAFMESSLSSVTIPASAEDVNGTAFANCLMMREINVDADNRVYSSDGGVLFNKNKSKLVAFPSGRSGEYTVPETVTSLGDGSFYCCKFLNKITVSDNVKGIGTNAFAFCSGLKEAYLPWGITEIKDNTFYSCSGLKDVYFDGTENEWNDIYISELGNEYLFKAAIHFIVAETPSPPPVSTVEPTATPTVEPLPTSTVEPTATPAAEATSTPKPIFDTWKILQVDDTLGGVNIAIGDGVPLGTPFTIIMAKYKYDILLDIVIESHKTGVDGGNEYFVKLDRIFSAQDTDEYVKLMLWDNTGTCKPLAEFYEQN